jgi:hypothetical protein
VSNGTNTTACPLPAAVYVKMTVGSSSTANGVTSNTYVFKTYSDANCTVLYNVPVSIVVNYRYVRTATYADPARTPNPDVTTVNSTVTISSGSNQATSGALIYSGCNGIGDKQICYSATVTLQPGTGYAPWAPEN